MLIAPFAPSQCCRMFKYFAQVCISVCLFHIGGESFRLAPADCPDNCSGHGKCENINGTDTCVCEDEWGGVNCSYPNFNLPSDEAVSVTIRKDQYYYFEITIQDPPVKNLTIIVLGFTKDPKTKGPAVYIAPSYYPTTSHYKVMNDSFALRKYITILNPVSGKWRIAVRGQDPTPLILTVQANLDNLCINHCSRRGQCLSYTNGFNGCVCSEGFKGEACETHTQPMESSVLYSGFVLSGLWNHWYYDTPLGGVVAGKELVLSVSSSEEGYSPPVLYVQYNSLQTEKSNLCLNTFLSRKGSYPSHEGYQLLETRSCRIDIGDETEGRAGRWFIGVRGESNNSGPYTISAQLRPSQQ